MFFRLSCGCVVVVTRITGNIVRPHPTLIQEFRYIDRCDADDEGLWLSGTMKREQFDDQTVEKFLRGEWLTPEETEKYWRQIAAALIDSSRLKDLRAALNRVLVV